MAQATNTTTAGALLKELYTLPPVRVLNDKSFLHDKLTKEKAEMDFSGKYVRFPVTMRRALGRGSRADGGTLPSAIAEDIQDAKVYMKQHYYALEWTEVVEEATKGREGAFEKVVTMKMKNVAIDMAKELNRQWYNAANGALCGVTDTAAGLTITVTDPQFLHVNDLVDIVATNGTPITNGTARTITAINITTKVVTLDSSGGNVDPTGAEILVLNGNFGNEIEGLRSITNVGRVLHSIDSNAYPEWDGNIVNVSGAVAGESSFERIDDKVGRRGRGDVDLRLTTRGIRRRLADEFASQRRYLDEKAMDIKAGYKTISVNGVETVIDDDCPRGYVFAAKRDNLKVLKMTDPGFVETEAADGAYIELKNSTTAGKKEAVWQAWYRYHCTLVCTDPGTTGVIPDAEDDTDY